MATVREQVAREVRSYAKNRAFSKQTAEEVADRILAIPEIRDGLEMQGIA